VFDYDEAPLTPPETVCNIRVDGNRRVAESSSIIQLARERLRRSFDETNGVNRADSIITPRGRNTQARACGSEVDVIINVSVNKPIGSTVQLN